MSLNDEINRLTTDWKHILKTAIEKNTKLTQFYDKECSKYQDILPIYPPKDQVFRCFNYFNPEETKVVILGQDPYHGPNQAIGLSFGVDENTKIPPSLRNITKKLTEEHTGYKTTNTLEHWAKQGVLLLNAALTVRHKTPLSHMKEWLPFTTAVIKYLQENSKDIVFVAWGAFAHRLLENIGENHHLIVSSHPSPFSVSRKYKTHPSFKESSPFKKINSILEKPIEW